MKNECADLSKNHFNGRHFGIFGGHFGILPVFWGIFFLLENVAPSHNLVLKCKIPLDSIKKVCSYYSPNLNHISIHVHINK